MTDEPDLGFLDVACQSCGASALDGPMFPGLMPGEWLCERCADDGHDPISRLMEAEGIGFIEAVVRLARQRGLWPEVPS